MTRRSLIAVCSVVITSACASAPKPVVTAAPPPPSATQKLGWILQLEDERQVRGTSAGQDLIVMLADDQAHIRRRAALGLGRVRAVEAVPALGGMLTTEGDPEVRQMAAFALGLIGDASAVPALTTALSSTDALLQGRAAEALGSIGDKSAAAPIAAMITAHVQAGAAQGVAADDLGYPRSPALEAARLGTYALVRLSAYDQLASVWLDGDRPRSTWWPVAFAFQRVQDPRSAAALTALVQADGQITRAFAVRGLGAIKHAPSRPTLLALALDAAQPQPVRVQAIRALAAIGNRADAAGLLKLLTQAKISLTLQIETVTALGQLRDATSTDVLLDLASSSAPAVRSATLLALARIDADTFISVISGLGEDPHWSVRAAMATALGELGAERAEQRLTAMLDDEDQRVVPAVLTALAATGAASAPAALTAKLAVDDPVVRMAAANGLAQVKAVDRIPALQQALQTSASDGTYVARAATLAALAKLDRAAATPALTAALDDKDWAVRLRAAALLRELDPQSTAAAVVPAPPPAVAELSAIDALLSPAFTPTAYIDTSEGMIEVELAVVDAPRTVANFTALARRGFFTNIPWHRVVADFVVQGGDPRGDGEGGPGYTIRDEINQRPYLRGTVGMALDWADTGSSQFFITHSPQPHLDGRYTVFGQVIAGMDVVDRLTQWDVIRTVRIWDGVNWVGEE